MKRFLLLVCLLVVAVPSMAFAGAAEHFKGIYLMTSPAAPPEQQDPNFVLVDNNTLEYIWGEYGQGALPEDLVPLKNEQTLIVFVSVNGASIPFLVLEKGALITPTYLSVPGIEGRQFEMQKVADGSFEAALQLSRGEVYGLRLAAPVPLQALPKQLKIASPLTLQ